MFPESSGGPLKWPERGCYDPGDIKTKRASKKLDAKLYRPFRSQCIGRNGRSATLELPPRWRIHPTFHISLLEPYRGDPNRAPPPIDIDADGEGWTPEAIVAAGPDDENPRHHKFLVKWLQPRGKYMGNLRAHGGYWPQLATEVLRRAPPHYPGYPDDSATQPPQSTIVNGWNGWTR
jgi:hypothetical protein